MAENKEKKEPTDEQKQILLSKAKNLVISASAGSGKTFIVIEKLIDLICEKKVPVERLLVLTFTKAASAEMKSRLTNAILEREMSPELSQALDLLPLSDISTIDSFCEKVIKRNISKLKLNENFTILNEKSAKKLKNLAFLNTYQHFIEHFADDFEEIYLAFSKDKDKIEECIYYIQDYFSSKWGEEESLKYFIDNAKELNHKSEEFLKDFISDSLTKCQKVLETVEGFTETEKLAVEQARNICQISLEGDIFDISQRFGACTLPALKGKHRDEIKIPFDQAKLYLKKVKEITEEYEFIFPGAKEKAENALLPKTILTFYKIYTENYQKLKEKRSALDFADLERLTRELLESEDVKKSLQEKYDYIFIDEYQDTNRLQESILKPIAQGGYFVAVGDIKQGIYGFRNASMDIMLEDIKNFSEKEDGEALYLNGNFRTESGILSFVNDIFEKIMTKESVGIDYKEKSKLVGLQTFLPTKIPSVTVDILKEEQQKEEKEFKIYSVREDTLKGDEKLSREVNAIVNRIEEMVTNKIYDAKQKKYRQTEFGDIALLFRERSTLMKEVVKRLREIGVPVNADLKEPLINDNQIALLLALLKLTINIKDDISLASVMCSIFGKFSLEELANLRKNNYNKKFWEIVVESKDEKIVNFLKMIEEFKFEIQVFGVIKSLNRLFNRHCYYEQLSNKIRGREKKARINSLFKFIRNNDLNFDVPSLTSILESSTDNDSGEGGGNAITITTIHATKGLEYPIVILCGCGESLKKPYTKSYVLTENYGLGCNLYDFDSMIKLPSPSFIAGRKASEKREFVDEIMIFYVALTRAQNNLFIIGSGKESDFTFNDLGEQKSYLKLIMYALGKNFTSQLFSQGKIKTENREFNILSDCKENKEKENKIIENKSKFEKDLKEYDEFVYDGIDECKINLKNSVTSALKIDDESVSYSDRVSSREEAINRGNAYHEALKLIDFDSINCVKDILSLPDLKEKMTKGYYELLDFDLLYKNIQVIKGVLKGEKLFKEKEFIMECSPQELGLKARENSDNKIIVQGVVDLFGIGEKIILIDYKFSSIKDESKLLNHYSKQLELYSKAIEKALNREVQDVYLLSLKEGKLIKK